MFPTASGSGSSTFSTTGEAVAEHLAFNLLKGRRLGSLDGFANLGDDKVALLTEDWLDWWVTEVETKV